MTHQYICFCQYYTDTLEINNILRSLRLQDARIKLIPYDVGILASYNRKRVGLRTHHCATRSAGVSLLPSWPPQLQWPLLGLIL